MRPERDKRERVERNQRIYDAWRKGMNSRELSEAFQLSEGRVYQIVLRESDRRKLEQRRGIIVTS